MFGSNPDREISSRSGGVLRAAAFVAMAGLLTLGCSTPGLHQIQIDLDSIQQQLWKIQKENAALTEEVARLRDPRTSPAVSAEGGGAPELKLRIENLEHEIERLRARLDETDQRMSAVVHDLRATRDALQALMAAPPAGGSGAPAGALEQLSDASAPTDGGAVTGMAPLTLDNLYRQGYADYTKGNYSLALQGLRELLERHPESPQAEDAQYLVGEIYFSQQEYLEAVEAFDLLVKNFPEGDKTGPAYLKKGLALFEMNRTADAVVQLQHVIDVYPKSEEARIARERLRDLGLEER
jgi:tol-pal system protein YbgF